MPRPIAPRPATAPTSSTSRTRSTSSTDVTAAQVAPEPAASFDDDNAAPAARRSSAAPPPRTTGPRRSAVDVRAAASRAAAGTKSAGSALGDAYAAVARHVALPCANAARVGTLVDVPGAQKLGGVGEKKIVVDEATGQRFVFKAKIRGEALAECEMFSATLRARAGVPVVPVVAVEVGGVQGTAKPFVDNDGHMGIDPTTWTAAQQTMIVGDHPWLELLGNYDAKADQYIVVGDGALNIDWDRAIEDIVRRPTAHDEPLSRNKRHWISPSCQEQLWFCYVLGEVDVDKTPIWTSIHRIEGLTRRGIEDALQPFAEATFGRGVGHGPYQTKDALVDAIVARQQTLRPRFADLVERMDAERAEVAALVARGVNPLQAAGTQDLALLACVSFMASPLYDVGNQLAQSMRAVWRTFREPAST